MLIVSNVVVIAGILVAFLAATFLGACLLTYLGCHVGWYVVATWAIVTVSVTVLARLLSGLVLNAKRAI